MDLGEVIKTAIAVTPLAIVIFVAMVIREHLDVIGYAVIVLAALAVCAIIIRRRRAARRRTGERDAIDALLDETD